MDQLLESFIFKLTGFSLEFLVQPRLCPFELVLLFIELSLNLSFLTDKVLFRFLKILKTLSKVFLRRQFGI